MSDSSQDKQNAFLSHLLGIFMILGPLIFWLIKKNESEVANREAKKCLNFQITAFIAIVVLQIAGVVLAAIVGILGMVLFLAAGLVWLGQFVLVIINALKANKGEATSYPFSLNLIK